MISIPCASIIPSESFIRATSATDSNALVAPDPGTKKAPDGEPLLLIRLNEFSFFDSGLFTDPVAEVVESGSSNLTSFQHFYFYDIGRHEWKNPLYTHTV